MSIKFPKYLFHEHSPDAINARLNKTPKKLIIRDFIYGAIDGAVTTFTIVASVKGANLPIMTVIVLGTANILADGFSMAASNYLGVKSERDEQLLVKKFEQTQIQDYPQGEIEEIRQLFRAKGFAGDLLEKSVATVVENREQWLKMMMVEEYGFSLANRSPIVCGFTTFVAFILFGLIPLLPYFLKLENSFMYATIFTGISFIVLGIFKSLWSLESAWISSLKTFSIGSVAAGLAYFLGAFLKDLV